MKPKIILFIASGPDHRRSGQTAGNRAPRYYTYPPLADEFSLAPHGGTSTSLTQRHLGLGILEF